MEMRSRAFGCLAVLVMLFCVQMISALPNRTKLWKVKSMQPPVFRIQIVEKDKKPQKVTAKIIGNGQPIPKIMARIYHGPKSSPMIRRKVYTQSINSQPFYYTKPKFPIIKSYSPVVHKLQRPLRGSVGSVSPSSQFRGGLQYPVQLHFTSTNELESNQLSDNSIIRPTNLKGYLPLNGPQPDYLQPLRDIYSNEDEFLGKHQSNFLKLSENNPQSIPVHDLNDEGIYHHHLRPQTNHPKHPHHQPHLSEDARRYIEFMASGEYFLPKVQPDYHKAPTDLQNYYVSQPKYSSENPTQRYIPLNQGMQELSVNRSPEKIEFTEQDAIRSQHNGNPARDSQIDIRARFPSKSIFGRKKEHETRVPADFLFEGVVKEPQIKRMPEIDDNDNGKTSNEIIRASGYNLNNFCHKKCSGSKSENNVDLLCGTDKLTYQNEAQLLCIVSCTNTVIDIDYRGACMQDRS